MQHPRQQLALPWWQMKTSSLSWREKSEGKRGCVRTFMKMDYGQSSDNVLSPPYHSSRNISCPCVEFYTCCRKSSFSQNGLICYSWPFGTFILETLSANELKFGIWLWCSICYKMTNRFLEIVEIFLLPWIQALIYYTDRESQMPALHHGSFGKFGHKPDFLSWRTSGRMRDQRQLWRFSQWKEACWLN